MPRPKYPSYSLAIWRRLRLTVLTKHPWCTFCAQGRCNCPRRSGRPLAYDKYKPMYCITAATVVDHIEPHKGDWTLFLDPANLQSLCKECHDKGKRIIDNANPFDVDGYPLEERKNGPKV